MRHKALDLQQLQMFVTTAEERSMSAAALRLGTTQSAVSQAVRQLEDMLGVVLFDRQHRPLKLTPAALTLFNRGRVLLRDSAQIRSEVLEASLGIAPEVTIGLVDSFAATCGPHFIKRMLDRTVRMAVRSGLTPYQGEQLLARELDIVITTDSLQGLHGTDGPVARQIYSEPFVVLTPVGPRLRGFSRQALQRLAASTPMIRFNAKSHLGAQVDTLLRRLDLRVAPRLEVNTADTLVAMVAAGLGWALTTPTCLLQGSQHAAGVHAGLISGVSAGRSLYLVGRQGEQEKLFEAAFAAAREAAQQVLVPALRKLAPGLAPSIEIVP